MCEESRGSREDPPAAEQGWGKHGSALAPLQPGASQGTRSLFPLSPPPFPCRPEGSSCAKGWTGRRSAWKGGNCPAPALPDPQHSWIPRASRGKQRPSTLCSCSSQSLAASQHEWFWGFPCFQGSWRQQQQVSNHSCSLPAPWVFLMVPRHCHCPQPRWGAQTAASPSSWLEQGRRSPGASLPLGQPQTAGAVGRSPLLPP